MTLSVSGSTVFIPEVRATRLDFQDKHCSSHHSPSRSQALYQNLQTPPLCCTHLFPCFFSKQVTVLVLIFKNLSTMSYAVAVLFVRNDCASRCPNANETSSRPPGWHLWTEKQQQAGAGGLVGGRAGLRRPAPLGQFVPSFQAEHSLHQ